MGIKLSKEWKEEKGKRYVHSAFLGTYITGREIIVYRIFAEAMLLSILPAALVADRLESGSWSKVYDHFTQGVYSAARAQ